MTPVDDLKTGMWIAIIGCRDEQQSQYETPFFFGHKPAFQCDGVPHKILSISLPFLLVSHPNGTGTVDVRRFMVRKLSKQYVERYFDVPPASRPGSRRKKKHKTPKGHCPRCGERLIQRRVINPDPRKQCWFIVCSGCGFEQGPAQPPDKQ